MWKKIRDTISAMFITNLLQQEQQRVAVGPGNAQFISIRQVSSSDAATLRRGTCDTVLWSAAAAAADTALGSLLIKKINCY